MTKKRTMGNCLKRSTTDEISLLRGGDSTREPSADQLTASLYQVSLIIIHCNKNIIGNLCFQQDTYPIQIVSPVYHPSPSVTQPVTQLSEEEQIKIAKRTGLIQHLPTGTYDGIINFIMLFLYLCNVSLGNDFRHKIQDKLSVLPCV